MMQYDFIPEELANALMERPTVKRSVEAIVGTLEGKFDVDDILIAYHGRHKKVAKRPSVTMALQRLKEEGKIEWVSRGVYKAVEEPQSA